jgi:uncharacterized small protein (DUF1192 family)
MTRLTDADHANRLMLAYMQQETIRILQSEIERREAQLCRLGLSATFAQVDYWRSAQRALAITVAAMLRESDDE